MKHEQEKQVYESLEKVRLLGLSSVLADELMLNGHKITQHDLVTKYELSLAQADRLLRDYLPQAFGPGGKGYDWLRTKIKDMTEASTPIVPMGWSPAGKESWGQRFRDGKGNKVGKSDADGAWFWQRADAKDKSHWRGPEDSHVVASKKAQGLMAEGTSGTKTFPLTEALTEDSRPRQDASSIKKDLEKLGYKATAVTHDTEKVVVTGSMPGEPKDRGLRASMEDMWGGEYRIAYSPNTVTLYVKSKYNPRNPMHNAMLKADSVPGPDLGKVVAEKCRKGTVDE